MFVHNWQQTNLSFEEMAKKEANLCRLAFPPNFAQDGSAASMTFNWRKH